MIKMLSQENLRKVSPTSVRRVIKRSIKKRAQIIRSLGNQLRLKNKKNDGLVVYHAMTAYHFLECITDKLVNNNEKAGVFIISVYLSELYPNYMDIVKRGVFSHILIYDIIDYSKADSVEEYEQNLKNYFDELLASISVSIKDFDQIHIIGAHHGFGSYVCMNNVRFYFYEEAAGLLSNPTIISDFEKSYYPFKGMITERDGLFEGNNDLIIEIRCRFDSQNFDRIDKKVRNFEITSLLSKIDNDALDFIMNFFKIPNDVPFKKRNMILLGQKLSSPEKETSEKDYIRTYQLLIDYYSDAENIIFKPHPADMSEYERYFNDIHIIRDKFPSELLLFLNNASYQIAMTINSTSMQTIEKNIESKRFIGYWFMDFKEIINRCWFAFSIVSFLKNKKAQCFYYGIQSDQVKNFLLYTKEFEGLSAKWLTLSNIPDNSISIINDIQWSQQDGTKSLLDSMKKMSDSSILIFINQNNDFCFYDLNEPELMNFIIPMTITKEKLKSDVVDDMQDETIYIFSKNPLIKERLLNQNFEKYLMQTGIYLRVNAMNQDKLEIAQLKSKVSAMECHLKSVLNQVHRNSQ